MLLFTNIYLSCKRASDVVNTLMVISTKGIQLYAKVSPLFNIVGVHCCLHANYIVNKHFYMSLHVGSSDPTYVRPVPLIVFEILGFKLKNKNDKIF